MKTFLLVTLFCFVQLGFLQEIEVENTPLIKIVSVDEDFIDFIFPIISNPKCNTSNCDKYYWYLYELNDEIILTKSPLSSILSRNVLYDNYKGMLTTFKNERIFISIKTNSILNKKIYSTDFFIDFNDFDIDNGAIPFYECTAYKLNVNKKTFKFELMAKRG